MRIYVDPDGLIRRRQLGDVVLEPLSDPPGVPLRAPGHAGDPCHQRPQHPAPAGSCHVAMKNLTVLGIAIVGGLIVSQALTLFTTPVVYLYLDRVANWTRKSTKRIVRRGFIPDAWRMRAASSTAIEPVPLSVVPVPRSHESR